MTRLFQAEGPIGTAGFVVEDGWVVRAAPILRKHIKGVSIEAALILLKNRGWTVTEIPSAE